MEFLSALQKSDPHQRTIIHLDMDCYYAQVEEVRDPTLRNRPVGVQQKNIVVTSNYAAREFGVKKMTVVSEAQRLCPTLVLVNGEDLTPYRQMSQRIFELLLQYTPHVEKLGFDENFLDVSALVQARSEAHAAGTEAMSLPKVEGNIYPSDGGDSELATACTCGCAPRLALGTQIAQEIRTELHAKLGLTCCAGISYNKLLAKLVGAQNKPNQQTVLVSAYAEQFMRELGDLHRITGIGQKTETLLLESGIKTVTQLQSCDMDFLRKKFGFETATKLKDLSFGRDASTVRASGKPKTISLEDSCRPISVRTDVEERFRLLLMRLVEQVAEDGRIPIAIKVVLRKYDAQKKASHRETKQANILPSLFKTLPCSESGGAKVLLADGAQEKLLKIIMRLFERVVDLNKPFNITLIGLAFSKFQQRKMGSSSIANFLIKKTDLEVQSITSLTNTGVTSNSGTENNVTSCSVAAAAGASTVPTTSSNEGFRSSPTTFQPSDQFYRRRATTASPIPMLVDNGSESAATNSDFSDFSETEVEPSPKKSRIGRLLMAKRRCLADGNSSIYSNDTTTDSPSKLRVSDLRLNSRDSEKDFPMNTSNATTMTTMSPMPLQRLRVTQPPSSLLGRIDRPPRAQTYRQFSTPSTSANSSPLPSPMDESCSGTTTPTSTLSITSLSTPLSTEAIAAAVIGVADELRHCDADVACAAALPVTTTATTSVNTATTTATTTITNIPCPAGVDPEVFNELPLDVQNELIASWRDSLAAAAAAAAVATSNVPSLPAASNAAVGPTQTNASTAKAGGAQKNTLYRYFLRNK